MIRRRFKHKQMINSINRDRNIQMTKLFNKLKEIYPEKLKDYKLIDNANDIPLGSHIKYISLELDLNKLHYGILVNKTQLDNNIIHLTLKNPINNFCWKIIDTHNYIFTKPNIRKSSFRKLVESLQNDIDKLK